MSDEPAIEGTNGRETPAARPTTQRSPRESLLLPVVIPFAAFAVIGLVLWAFSRILLNTTHVAATVVAVIAAVGIVAISAYVAGRKQLSNAGLFSMVGGAAGIAMLAGGVALVAAPPHGAEEEGPPPVVIAAPVGAAETGFESDAVQAPAGVPFEIEFDNQDTQPHNVFIATEEGGENLFEGSTVTGPVVTTYQVEEPLEAGSYFFFCSVHPTTMTGTLEAVPGGEEGGEGGGITVAAQELAFEPTEFELPADEPTTITFDDRDDVGTFGQHNLSIYEDEAYTAALFTGPLVDGPAVVPLELPALPEGSYPFRCDIHAQMVGTVTVVPTEAGGGGGGAEEGGGGGGAGEGG